MAVKRLVVLWREDKDKATDLAGGQTNDKKDAT